MVIDSHQHFWRYERGQYPWITEDISVLRRDYLPEDLAMIMDRNNIDGTVVVQARQNILENEFLTQLASEQPWILGVVGWINLTDPNAEELIQHWANYTFFKGIRYTFSPDLWELNHKVFVRSLRTLASKELTFDLLVHETTIKAAVQLTRQFPDNKFVLNHIGKPDIRAGLTSPWASHIKDLGERENVSCKVSGLVSRPRDASITQAGFTRFLDVVLEHFGSSRLMFGSDWPVCTLCKTYAEVLDVIKTYIAKLPDSEKAAIMGQNTLRIYELTPSIPK